MRMYTHSAIYIYIYTYDVVFKIKDGYTVYPNEVSGHVARPNNTWNFTIKQTIVALTTIRPLDNLTGCYGQPFWIGSSSK